MEEKEIIQALLEAAELKNNDNQRVSIERNGKTLFTFTINGLSEDDWELARRHNLKNRGKKNETLDKARFLSEVIYLATDDDDRKRLWNQKAVWQKFNAVNGADVINAVLKPGEKARLAELIEDLSGYGDEDNVRLDEEIKN